MEALRVAQVRSSGGRGGSNWQWCTPPRTITAGIMISAAGAARGVASPRCCFTEMFIRRRCPPPPPHPPFDPGGCRGQAVLH